MPYDPICDIYDVTPVNAPGRRWGPSLSSDSGGCCDVLGHWRFRPGELCRASPREGRSRGASPDHREGRSRWAVLGGSFRGSRVVSPGGRRTGNPSLAGDVFATPLSTLLSKSTNGHSKVSAGSNGSSNGTSSSSSMVTSSAFGRLASGADGVVGR